MDVTKQAVRLPNDQNDLTKICNQKDMQQLLELIGSRCSITIGTSRMTKKANGRNQLRVKGFELIWEAEHEDVEDGDEDEAEDLGLFEEVRVDRK